MAGFKGDLAVEESMGSEVRIGVVMVVVLSVWLVILLGEVRGEGVEDEEEEEGEEEGFCGGVVDGGGVCVRGGGLELLRSLGLATVSFKGARKPSVFQTPEPLLVSVPCCRISRSVSVGMDAMMMFVCLEWCVYALRTSQGMPCVASDSNMSRVTSR